MRLLLALTIVALCAARARADPGDECLATLEVDGAIRTTAPHGIQFACTDCDPRCDHDGASAPNGSCAFSLRACVNDASEATCPPGAIRRLRVEPRHVSLPLPALPSAAAPGCAGSWGPFEVGSRTRRIVLTARAKGHGPRRRRDVDRHVFTCTSRPAGEPCPAPPPVCGDGTITMPEQCDPGTAPDGCSAGTICRTAGEHACRCTACDAVGPTTHTLVLAPRGGPAYCDAIGLDTFPAGDVRDLDERLLADLYPSCLYAGHAFSRLAARVEAGTRRAFTVTAPQGCLAGKIAVGSSPATSGPGAAGCTEPGCVFAAPLPIFNTALSSCVVPVITGPVEGTLDVDRGDLTLDVPLDLRVYLTTAEIYPCPVCIDGFCRGGTVDGTPCDAGDPFSCPIGGTLLGTISLTLPVSTTPAHWHRDDGLFCPAQPAAGALGQPAGRSIRVAAAGTMQPLVAGEPFLLDLAGLFCTPPSGTPILDAISGLPGPGALALPVVGQLD